MEAEFTDLINKLIKEPCELDEDQRKNLHGRIMRGVVELEKKEKAIEDLSKQVRDISIEREVVKIKCIALCEALNYTPAKTS